MRRILLIARRDYLQTVLSKAFLIGLIMLPLLFGGGFLAIAIANKGGVKEQRIAILDHTGISAAAVIQTCEESNHRANTGDAAGLRVAPHFAFEEMVPDADEAAQLLSLSDRIRRGELFLVLEISADALRPAPGAKELIRYYSNTAGISQLALWLPAAVNEGLRRVRLEQLGIAPARVTDALQDVAVVSMNLATKDPVTGKTVQGEEKRGTDDSGAGLPGTCDDHRSDGRFRAEPGRRRGGQSTTRV